jgi:hypothetical protein
MPLRSMKFALSVVMSEIGTKRSGFSAPKWRIRFARDATCAGAFPSGRRRAMGNVIDIETSGEKALKERTRVVEMLHTLATRIEALPEAHLLHALPIAASGVADLERRLAPWLR